LKRMLKMSPKPHKPVAKKMVAKSKKTASKA
jgi:hypothetical protein